MTTTTTETPGTETAVTTQVFRVYIKTTPQAIWDAITKPEWTNRYGYTGFATTTFDQAAVRGPRATRSSWPAPASGEVTSPTSSSSGEVIEVDPPHTLVTTFRMLMDPEMATEVQPHHARDQGPRRLLLTHDHPRARQSPRCASLVSGSLEEFGAGGGHAWVLSDLKSLLETGSTLAE